MLGDRKSFHRARWSHPYVPPARASYRADAAMRCPRARQRDRAQWAGEGGRRVRVSTCNAAWAQYRVRRLSRPAEHPPPTDAQARVAVAMTALGPDSTNAGGHAPRRASCVGAGHPQLPAAFARGPGRARVAPPGERVRRRSSACPASGATATVGQEARRGRQRARCRTRRASWPGAAAAAPCGTQPPAPLRARCVKAAACATPTATAGGHWQPRRQRLVAARGVG